MSLSWSNNQSFHTIHSRNSNTVKSPDTRMSTINDDNKIDWFSMLQVSRRRRRRRLSNIFYNHPPIRFGPKSSIQQAPLKYFFPRHHIIQLSSYTTSLLCVYIVCVIFPYIERQYYSNSNNDVKPEVINSIEYKRRDCLFVSNSRILCCYANIMMGEQNICRLSLTLTRDQTMFLSLYLFVNNNIK